MTRAWVFVRLSNDVRSSAGKRSRRKVGYGMEHIDAAGKQVDGVNTVLPPATDTADTTTCLHRALFLPVHAVALHLVHLGPRTVFVYCQLMDQAFVEHCGSSL